MPIFIRYETWPLTVPSPLATPSPFQDICRACTVKVATCGLVFGEVRQIEVILCDDCRVAMLEMLTGRTASDLEDFCRSDDED